MIFPRRDMQIPWRVNLTLANAIHVFSPWNTSRSHAAMVSQDTVIVSTSSMVFGDHISPQQQVIRVEPVGGY